jgi:hypothetical protein
MAEDEGPGKRVDRDKLAKRQPPLAKVMEALALPSSRTWRDVDQEVARDIALLMEARDPESPLAQALSDLEADRGGKASQDELHRDLKSDPE